MLKIYGTMVFEDCMACVESFTGKGILCEFYNFTKDLENFKEFMLLRDTNPLFE